MSNKSSVLRARGNAKSVTTLFQVGKRGGGNALTAAAFQIWDEMSVYPPATRQEAEAFCRVHIKRCNINLANAKDRGDKRAMPHLERKLAVYEYLYRMVKAAPPATECPNCRVTAVEHGVCSCCGQRIKGVGV